MNTGNQRLLISGLAVAGAGYLFMKGFNVTSAIQRLTYTNPKIKVGKLNVFQGLALEVQLDFVNHASENISMEYFTGDILYQGLKVAGFEFNANGKNQVIKARSTTTIPFTVVVKTFGAIQLITKLITAIASKSGVDTVLTLDGAFYAAGIDIPVKFAYDVKTQSLVSRNDTQKKVSGIGGIDNPGKKKLTGMMRRTENNINWFNKKYNYQIDNASVQHQKEYKSLLRTWDFLKQKRDQAKGIGDASARLSFKSNDEMTNYFRQDQIRLYKPKSGFSKN